MSNPLRSVSLPIRLRFPISIGSGREMRKYGEIVLRPPTRQDIIRLSDFEPGTDQAIALISLVAGVPMDVIEQLGPRDYYTACKFLEPFAEHPYGE
ncbi:phage tail assembly protein [Caballeronia zhejiangensis]|uniref:phage tail assembly protein n=1 Tax=Caballeronia zhejiangensis TaxID=871203 RepID=UPI001364C58B|nr:phage tail assembly protein [Caballeronia zhejiangensis]